MEREAAGKGRGVREGSRYLVTFHYQSHTKTYIIKITLKVQQFHRGLNGRLPRGLKDKHSWGPVISLLRICLVSLLRGQNGKQLSDLDPRRWLPLGLLHLNRNSNSLNWYDIQTPQWQTHSPSRQNTSLAFWQGHTESSTIMSKEWCDLIVTYKSLLQIKVIL